MSFIEKWLVESDQSTPLLLSSDQTLSYGEVSSVTDQLKDFFHPCSICVFLFDNTIPHVIVYLAMLRARCTPLIVPAESPEASIVNYVERYHAEYVVGISEKLTRLNFARYESKAISGTNLGCIRFHREALAVNDDLALLIPTSGSTGDSKLVRLSHRSIRSCITATVSRLEIQPCDTAITTLPLSYSYGLSVLHAQICAGASIVVGKGDLFSKDFWRDLDRFRVTIMPTVPKLLEILVRSKLISKLTCRLRLILCAGGKLRESIGENVLQWSLANKLCFVNMYGSTEASPRMTIMPLNTPKSKSKSVGKPLDCGQIFVRSSQDGVSGELVYRGPNVGLGYAECREDLYRGDEFGGEFATGDYGFVDSDGFVYVEGRIKRLCKAHGVTVNLDHLTDLLMSKGLLDVACLAGDDSVVVFHTNMSLKSEILAIIKLETSIAISAIKPIEVDEMPMNQKGYPNLHILKSLMPYEM